VCVLDLGYPACNPHAPHCQPCPVWPYDIFPHYLINSMIFERNCLNIKYFWFSLQRFYKKFLILRNERDMIKNILRSSCKVLFIYIRFWWNFNFLDRFSKNAQISNLMRIHSAGAKLFFVDRQTWSLFAILRKHLKVSKFLSNSAIDCGMGSITEKLRLDWRPGQEIHLFRTVFRTTVISAQSPISVAQCIAVMNHHQA
jgi:hypothetical protein